MGQSWVPQNFDHTHKQWKTGGAHSVKQLGPFRRPIWAMVNTHYMVDGHPIHNKDPYIINPYEPLDD